MTIREVTDKVIEASNIYELTNNINKVEYIKKNIAKITQIFKKIPCYRGVYGTGYPFYLFWENVNDYLPVIKEQIRYNEELLIQRSFQEDKPWYCEECLKKNYHDMIDLKHICKPCPNVLDELKPRKLMNRLPDLDMWIIVEDGQVDLAAGLLTKFFEEENMRTTDVDPLRSIEEVYQISSDLNYGEDPNCFLPLDIHIIEETELMILIGKVKKEFDDTIYDNRIPYVPIHPLSYRKIWQKDDTAYNFAFDYLASFTLIDGSQKMKTVIETTRSTLTSNYTTGELIEILKRCSPESHLRRLETKEMQKSYKRRIKKWQEI